MSSKSATWFRSLLAPRDRLLPGIGARLSGHPRLAASVLSLLSLPPKGPFRAALYRNVSRPLSRRLATRLEVPVEGGLRMVVDTTDILGRSLATRRVWEPHVTRVFGELLASGDVFVDVGAHIGYYSLIASKIVGPTGGVYALEPHPSTCELLRVNLQLNEAANVRPLAVAAGADRGIGAISVSRAGDAARMSLLATGADEGTTVAIAPLAELVDQDDVARLRLVKIDVEGFEDRVLQGIEPLLAQGARPAILLEVHAHLNPDVTEHVADFCRRYAIRAYLIGDDAGYDQTFRLGEASAYTAVTPAWIVSTSSDHYELLLLPAESAP